VTGGGAAPDVDRVVVVGASLAGWTAAQALRAEGFTGRLTLIGDEGHAPYDRPPLSKAVLSGWLPAHHTDLPEVAEVDAEWLLGTPAAGLDLAARDVRLADGRRVGYDRLLIATGTRARPWPDPAGAALDGVFTLRTREDATALRARLADAPRRVLVVGAGFTGSEIASVTRDLGLPVTVVERSTAPLAGPLGGAAGAVAARVHRAHGVDLRCNTTVMALEGDVDGRLRAARLSDGDVLEADVAVVALGAVRNVEWLAGAGLAADARGVVCDAACRVFDADAIVLDDVFVAGDVARWPHPLYDGELLAVEHWGNAVDQARTAAHNMVCPPADRRAHRGLPAFWSNQFGDNIKSVGVPPFADQIALVQGSVEAGRFAAAYGRRGRTVAAVTVNMPRALAFYAGLVAAGAPFPPVLHPPDGPAEPTPLDAGFPPSGQATHSSGAVPTGPGPSAPPEAAPGPAPTVPDPRTPPGAAPLSWAPSDSGRPPARLGGAR
jgi:NADPH-dependent 2,4-dienoyl-CoA reductase/sulfur reductase-like enzyme